jgi:hypothetical protein
MAMAALFLIHRSVLSRNRKGHPLADVRRMVGYPLEILGYHKQVESLLAAALIAGYERYELRLGLGEHLTTRIAMTLLQAQIRRTKASMLSRHHFYAASPFPLYKLATLWKGDKSRS